MASLDALIADAAESEARYFGDVHSAYLPYAERLLTQHPDARFICLQRDRAATVKSFLAKTARKANHWAPTPRMARHARAVTGKTPRAGANGTRASP